MQFVCPYAAYVLVLNGSAFRQELIGTILRVVVRHQTRLCVTSEPFVPPCAKERGDIGFNYS